MRRALFLRSSLLLALVAPLAACGDAAVPAVDAGTDAGADAGHDARVTCTAAADCDDALYCNGAETCAPGTTGADVRGCVAGTAPCASDVMCAEDSDSCGTCSIADVDADGVSECDGDCDDADPARHPGATEVCDSDDEDCNDATFGTLDTDADGYVSASCCDGATCGDDCDDSNPDVHPAQTEACNGLDDNCNGAIDEDVMLPWYVDGDGDGYGAAGSASALACTQPAGHVASHDDCDDTASAVHPGAVEICDAIENNCDGSTDIGCPCTLGTTMECGATRPGGGFYTIAPCHSGTQTCVMASSGTLSVWTSCAGNRDPASVESCATPEDDDCDGATNDAAASDAINWYPDSDNDSFGSATAAPVRACSSPALGYVANNTDCDDASAAVHLGATEACNGVDDNCNGLFDGPGEDTDGDGYVTATCGGSDCDDARADTHPAAPEVCDLYDSDCSVVGHAHSGATPAINTIEIAEDRDGDGHASLAAACTGGLLRDDCDDSRASDRPGAVEVCDGRDNDCDLAIDEEPDAAVNCAPSAPPNTLSMQCVGGACVVLQCNAGFVSFCGGCATPAAAALTCPPDQPLGCTGPGTAICGCGPGTCAGCCRGNTCMGGYADDNCGIGGVACDNCFDLDPLDGYCYFISGFLSPYCNN